MQKLITWVEVPSFDFDREVQVWSGFFPFQAFFSLILNRS